MIHVRGRLVGGTGGLVACGRGGVIGGTRGVVICGRCRLVESIIVVE